MEEQKFQQFQEYDVSMMLKQQLNVTKVKGSKEMSDLGATRVVVDECFEHVYFSLEHYRAIKSQEVTARSIPGSSCCSPSQASRRWSASTS